jgi:conjugal transfer pilus assembly protein TraF
VNATALIATVFLVTTTMVAAQEERRPYWIDAWRGWHFYEDPEEEPPPDRTSTPPHPRATASRPQGLLMRRPELAEFERLQSDLEDARKVAVVRPTEANVRRYMEMEAAVVARASTFADVAQRVAWATPQLDPTLQGRPVNAMALEVFEQQRLADRSRAIGDIGRDHVLLFFYRSDCPYCHAFAPTILAFQARHGIKVEAVSIDGGPMPGFDDARRDNGIASALQVAQVPAVYLAQPFTGTITPIGFGVLSDAQLLERIAAVTAPGYRQMVPSAVQELGSSAQRAPASRVATRAEVRP